MTLTKASDQRGVDGVALRAKQFALPKGFDPSWVYHADAILAFIKIPSQSFPISAGGFHACIERRNLTIVEPCRELFEALSGVREDLFRFSPMA